MTKATALILMLGLIVSCRNDETDSAPVEAETPKQDVAKPASSPEELDRTVLPIPQPTYPPATELDARNAKAPPPFEVKAPEGAPNVVVVLIDDIGFGSAGSFGGPIATPTLDSLAEGGLRYNQFHTTALCSPTRMALLTGRNHHSANTGSVQEVATGFPGNNGMRPGTVAPLAEMLRLNGYSTAAFGKYHETPPWEVSVSGPFDRWPTHSGFDKFYGFIGGEANQWAPLIYDGTTQDRAAERPRLPLHHGHDRSGDQLDPVSAIAHARQAVLRILRDRRDACASPRPQRMDREIQRQV
jgi:arylsulfatase